MKKIPPGAEAANILVGEVDFLNHQIVAFIRLLKPLMADLTEVPVPTKFIFVILGPMGNGAHFHEIGRSIATLFSDEVSIVIMYHSRILCNVIPPVIRPEVSIVIMYHSRILCNVFPLL